MGYIFLSAITHVFPIIHKNCVYTSFMPTDVNSANIHATLIGQDQEQQFMLTANWPLRGFCNEKVTHLYAGLSVYCHNAHVIIQCAKDLKCC